MRAPTGSVCVCVKTFIPYPQGGLRRSKYRGTNPTEVDLVRALVCAFRYRGLDSRQRTISNQIEPMPRTWYVSLGFSRMI